MSKQSDAKAAQGYQDKPTPHICMHCTQFAMDIALPNWAAKINAEATAKGHTPRYRLSEYGKEKNKRCTIGGFVVKKTATCKQFDLAPPAA
jgi:tRNA U34 2-thiouridine synthase MnmA/TrmU